MSYDINVLVNGNRCKQYFKNGKVFIEAKEGSEYVVEIKNNSWEKVLAVVSVDGLNVINGEAAEDTGAGYVMDRYTAQKLYGFQYSQDKVATFKFGALGAKDAAGNPLGYAASKGDGSEKNAGVIGVRIWDEIPKPPPPPPPPNPAPVYTTTTVTTTTTYSVSSSWASSSYSSNPANWNAGGLYGPGRFGYTPSAATAGNPPPGGYQSLFGGCAAKSSTTNANSRVYPQNAMGDLLKEAIADAKAVRATACSNLKSADPLSFNLQNMVEDHYIPVQDQTLCCTTEMPEMDKASFDMETQWGQSRSYKVKETTFERHRIIHTIDIYYASRESLIAMGIDLGTERRVSFPESFKESKYAKPPKGWQG